MEISKYPIVHASRSRQLKNSIKYVQIKNDYERNLILRDYVILSRGGFPFLPAHRAAVTTLKK